MPVERMTKIIVAALALASLATNAAAEQPQRTFYNLSGKVIGRSSTDSQGTVTNYDATGKVISRATTKRQNQDDLRCRWPGDRARDDEPLRRRTAL